MRCCSFVATPLLVHHVCARAPRADSSLFLTADMCPRVNCSNPNAALAAEGLEKGEAYAEELCTTATVPEGNGYDQVAFPRFLPGILALLLRDTDTPTCSTGRPAQDACNCGGPRFATL